MRVDIIVDDLVIVELKCVEVIHPIHRAQVVSYLKATGKPLGVLLNFNVLRMLDGYERIVHPDLLRHD